MSEPVVARATLLLRVAAGSGLGCLAAVVAVVVTRVITRSWLVDGAAVGVAACCVFAVAMLTSQDGGARTAGSPQPAGAGLRPVRGRPVPAPVRSAPAPIRATAPSPGPAPPRPPVSPPATLASQPPPPPSGPKWYEAAARGIAGQADTADPLVEELAGVVPPQIPPAFGPGPEPQPPGPTRPGLLEIVLEPASAPHGDVRQIVQCPRCGAFDVEGHRVRRGCTFACTGCGHQWHLDASTPGPVTVVRPRLTRTRPGEPNPSAPPIWHLNR